MKKITIILFLLLSIQVKAAVFNIANGDVAALIAAIVSANSNSEADVINLAMNGTYILTAVNYTSASAGSTGFEGQRGLPNILNNVTGLDLTINGNGATIQRNIASPNFGLFSCAGYTIFNGVTFRNANVNSQGAAIFVQFKGNIELINCKFYDNTSLIDAEGGGGAIYTKSLSVLKVTNCYFENNKAVNQGGAISNLLSDMTVTGSTFKNNRTTDLVGDDPAGGAIYVDGARGNNGALIIRNNLYEGNTSNGKGQGGAMFLFPYNNQSVEVTACTFKNNAANQGGAFWHKGGGSSGIPDSEYPLSKSAENTILLFNTCVFDGNTASNASGGALWISDCIINEIHSCTFKNNTASLGGAVALLTNRAFTFRNSTFNNNTANQSGAIFAGGISGILNITNCTFASNIANQYGGAMSVPQNATPVNITNCTFANNQANNAGNGQSGAIHSGNNTPNNTVTIKNNIFYNNTVTNTYGGGSNSLWRDCNAILNNGGNNIFFPAGTAQSCVTPLSFVDPLLSPLADNGGTTQTMALQAGSPAINAGAGCPTLDQRGTARVGACDIGAFEFEGASVNPTPTPTATKPSNPTNLQLKNLANNRIELSWQDNSNDETSFAIGRWTKADASDWKQVGTVGANVTRYTDTLPTNFSSADIFYSVHAVKDNIANGWSAKSADAGIKIVVTGLPNQIKKKLKIYPNPSSNGEFRVEIPQNLVGKALKVSIYNLQGQAIESFEVKTASDLPIFLRNKGIFFLILRESENIYVTKVVIE